MKLRVRYTKQGKVRFTSHRDVARIWERALRKAELPIAWSSGFSPRPRLSFGLALPTGAESLGEYLDIELAEGAGLGEAELAAPVARRALADRLTDALPTGFAVTAVALRPVGGSLQDDVVACTWELGLDGVSATEAGEAVAQVLAADELHLERERKGELRTDDVRPAISGLELAPDHDEIRVVATLAAEGRALRPLELVSVLFCDVDPLDVCTRVLRTHQWIERDGAWQEVLPVERVAHPCGVSAGKDERHDPALGARRL